MADIRSDSGGDPTNAIRQAAESQKDEMTREFIELWYQETTEWVNEAAERRSQLGEEKGRVGREMTGLFAMAKKAIPPFWDQREGAWTFAFPHEGAVFQEFGATPHEIRAKQAEVLAFEWPDQPEEVREQFEHTEGDLVFFEAIDHPGIPAIGFVRYGRDRAIRYLRKAGYDVEEFQS